MVEDPSSGNNSPACNSGAYMEVGYLPAIRAQLAHLEGLSDTFILRTPMSDKSKNVEDKLLANTKKLASCNILVMAGEDIRRNVLYPNCFMGARL